MVNIMNTIPNIDDIKEVKLYVEKYSCGTEENKKQKGEVFTPEIITNNMLDELNKAYKKKYGDDIYKNKNLKWYDNSSGIGNIMVCVYEKIYDGLTDIIIDKKKRKKHILENMLYMSEINENNIQICEKIFNPDGEYKLNLYNGDSLKININNIWNIKDFDIIIGNPPYQKNNNKTNSARGGKNNNLYLDFVKKSLISLKNDGFLVYIHPLNWRKINSDIFNEIKKHYIEHISLNYGGNLFKNVSVKTDFYVLRKCNNKDKNTDTTIKCYNKKSLLIFESSCVIDDEINFIPNLFSIEIKNIICNLNKFGENRKCINNSDCHKVRDHVNKGKTDLFKYPLYNTSGNPFEYFSSKVHKHQNEKKVLMSCSGKLSPQYDDGKYGTTQDSMYYLVKNKEEGDFIINILNTKLYKFLINICIWGNFRNEPLLFSYLKFPKFSKKNYDDYDDFVFNYFELNKKEIKTINKYYEMKF